MLPINIFAQSWALIGESGNFNGDVGVPSGSGYYVNGVQVTSAILSDVASIGMLDENEDVSGNWTFADWIDIEHDSDTPLSGPYLDIRRRRDGDPTYDCSSGDKVGMIDFSGYHTTYCEAARIMVVIDGTPGVSDMPGRLEFYTTPDNDPSPDLRMAIDSAGNIKMGDGAWTNYVNVSAGGALTLAGTATICTVDATEFGYLEGVTEEIQTALDTILANVLEDTTPELGGFLDVKEFYFLISDDLGSDHDYSGLVDSANVGESVVFGDLLYFDWTAVEWKKARANAIGTTPAQRIALESKADGQTCLMLVQGWIRDDSAFDFGASKIFLNDDIAGTCDDTAPAESGDQIQVVGIAIGADKMYFNPSIDVGEI